jgi:hypothetical protein
LKAKVALAVIRERLLVVLGGVEHHFDDAFDLPAGGQATDFD